MFLINKMPKKSCKVQRVSTTRIQRISTTRVMKISRSGGVKVKPIRSGSHLNKLKKNVSTNFKIQRVANRLNRVNRF